ncbi:MAG: hypothetical protein U0176_03185 [Bacteroidia bacterium]
MPREIVESFVTHFVSVWFPDVISPDQFQLLFEDNVAAVAPTTNLLGRRPQDMAFWRAEAGGSAVHAELGKQHSRAVPSELGRIQIRRDWFSVRRLRAVVYRAIP